MQNMNERPVCHRAEDLVTYLYGEASADAQDFAGHMQQCDACRAEFAVFQQVHDSMVVWRNEALGSALNSAQAPAMTAVTSDARQFVRHERRLSALDALREFFIVSPLWLRGAATLASLLLCVLVALAVSRLWQTPTQVVNGEGERKYTQEQFDREVKKIVDEKVAELNKQNQQNASAESQTDKRKDTEDQPQLAVSQPRPKTRQPKGLTRQEREQLAMDLRLVPSWDDEESPLVFPEEPK